VPDEGELSIARETLETVTGKSRELLTRLNVECGIEHVGSTAKGTQLKDADIDIFFPFDPSVPEETLRDTIFFLGKNILSDHEIRYAEHPYVRGTLEGIKIDLVPCYAVESGNRIMSAVDRTPFHTRYIIGHLTDQQNNEVRLLKQFMKGIGCYGAENRTMGFSGYLCELLTLSHGGFKGVLEAASDWKENTFIDIEGTGYLGVDEKNPLIVVDPVDPARNVASPVSTENISRFIHASREYLYSPSFLFFFPPDLSPWSRETLQKIIRSRGEFVVIRFKCPDVIDDILYPQLRMTLSRLQFLLKDNGFPLNDSGFLVTKDVFIFFDSGLKEHPETKLHRGPTIYNADHAERFLEKWNDRGPFIRGDRWYVFAPVKYRTPRELVENELPILSTGRYVREAISKGFRILDVNSIPENVLTAFLDKRMPWLRQDRSEG